jgi:hypothetical protein
MVKVITQLVLFVVDSFVQIYDIVRNVPSRLNNINYEASSSNAEINKKRVEERKQRKREQKYDENIGNWIEDFKHYNVKRLELLAEPDSPLKEPLLEELNEWMQDQLDKRKYSIALKNLASDDSDDSENDTQEFKVENENRTI